MPPARGSRGGRVSRSSFRAPLCVRASVVEGSRSPSLSRAAASGRHDGVDKLALRHVRSSTDADAGRELYEFGLLVGVETVPLIMSELARRPVRCRRSAL